MPRQLPPFSRFNTLVRLLGQVTKALFLHFRDRGSMGCWESFGDLGDGIVCFSIVFGRRY